MDKPKLYTARELADELKVHPQTIYRLGNTGVIKSVKVGFSRRFISPLEETKQCNQEKE